MTNQESDRIYKKMTEGERETMGRVDIYGTEINNILSKCFEQISRLRDNFFVL